MAYAIAHSPLVKTAFFASDPNLGRILAAVGYAGSKTWTRRASIFAWTMCTWPPAAAATQLTAKRTASA